ncbi:hypothetical protein Tco_0049166 [Tanacetum coccineum]
MADVNAPIEQAPAVAPPTTLMNKSCLALDGTDGGYKCQLDEEWFNLTKDTLRDALQITPINNNKASSTPLISIMRKGCGKNSLNPSIPSRKTKRIWHNTLRERRKPLSDYLSPATQVQVPSKTRVSPLFVD